MTTIAFTASDAAYWGLAIFLVAIGIASALIFVVLYLLILRLSDKVLAARGKRTSRIVKIL